LWHVAPDGSELERLAPPQEAQYDFDRIASKLAQLERYDAAWAAWFDQQGIEPLRLGYERLSINPGEAVSRIFKALGLRQPAPDALKPGVAKLADAISLEWMRNYQRDLRALSD
jgi:LPS sulfotransferase NodH